MSKIERYQGNVQAFASSAQGVERTVFGETTQANDLTSQITAAFLRGWGIVGPSEHPSLEDFNGAMYALSQFIAYQHQAGIPEWHEEQEYYAGSVCTHTGVAYQSIEDANTGNEPPSAHWTPVITSRNGSEYFQSINATLTALATLAGTKDKMPYFSGEDTAALTALTAFAREILAQTDAAGVLSKLGLRDVAHSQMTTYLTAGTFTFTVPDGVYRIKCRVIGGGGGAGGSASAKSGGGGGAGGYAEGWIDVTPGQTITITVGAGGQGGTAGNFGVSGGLSSVGGFMSASGGAYGDAGGGGTGAGGFGGAGTGGSVNSVGSDGSDGTTTGAVGAGAGGGSALGGSTRSGGSGRNSLSIGGGGSASYTTAAQSGGNGHAGAVILEY
ncbi:glycine-rich domain-containing protein [Kluyvera cryocrescens]|uniref:glycine-rich domain-containing protein n=1 Tax=Kluyvera cryocrescens TaxID=580 RepID=UPI000D92E0BF|nr:hypothetical protein [Kluyvera cryocrescens]SQC34205.1 Uncharacterised protein [Kluyvera cryocrescens]